MMKGRTSGAPFLFGLFGGSDHETACPGSFCPSPLRVSLVDPCLSPPRLFAQQGPECAAGTSVDTRLAAALAKPDRPDKVKANDPVRDSENRFMLQYVQPGDHVLDLGAGGGYSTWLLSAAVCAGGVDSQNPAQWVSSQGAQDARNALATARPNVHLVTSDFDKVPVPAKPYDAIFIGTIYHDTYNEPGADAVKMDKALFAALKPGGLVVVIDHSAVGGAGHDDDQYPAPDRQSQGSGRLQGGRVRTGQRQHRPGQSGRRPFA